MASRVELMLVQYANGERRVAQGREYEDGLELHSACASEFLAAAECESPLLDYDLRCNMTESEMAAIRDLDGVAVLRREQFQ